MGQSKTITFTLRNLSNTARKFSWTSVEGLTFSPSVGHLLPKTAKVVSATFAPTEATSHEAAPASLELQRIRYTADYADWDDSMKVVRVRLRLRLRVSMKVVRVRVRLRVRHLRAHLRLGRLCRGRLLCRLAPLHLHPLVITPRLAQLRMEVADLRSQPPLRLLRLR